MQTQALKRPKNEPRDQVYEDILPEITRMVDGENDLIATLGDITAILSQSFGHLEHDRVNVVDALYLERVFELLQRKYCAGGAR